MDHMLTKSRLAIELSKLNVFQKANIILEQYPTDSEIAATMLWHAYMQKEIENNVVADLGCGTGILGIGALLLGARYVYFVEIDKDALIILRENLKRLKTKYNLYADDNNQQTNRKNKYSIEHKDIILFNGKI